MKKIFFFIAITSLSLGFTSCSEDDPVIEIPSPNPNPNIEKQLTITSTGSYNRDKDMYYSPIGMEVTFTTKNGTTTIPDAVYYVDGVKIIGNKYKHTTIATVQVQARRAGYLDSNNIKVQFAQKPY